MQKIALLYDASQAVLSTFDLDEVLAQILRIASGYFRLENVAVMLLDDDGKELYIKARFGLEDGEWNIKLALGEGICGFAAQEKRPIYVPDVRQSSRYVQSCKSTRSELAIPLMVRDQVVGVLDFQSNNADHFDPETIDLLTLFSTQASMALQNARLYSLERQRAEQLEAINAIARQTTSVLDIEQLLEKVCSLVQQSFHVAHVSVLLRNEDELTLRANYGRLTQRELDGGKLPAKGNLWSKALITGSTLVENDPVKAGEVALYRETRACMCIPLISYGQAFGVLMLDSNESGTFERCDVQALESVADISATAIQNAHYVERVKQLAYRDGLTGIFNRRYFELRLTEELERAQRFEAGMAIVMVDIDQFKRLNDDFGHLLGDEVLRQVSSLLHEQLRKFDVICRYGGEEFAVLLSQTNPEHALNAAEKLRKAVESWQFPGLPRSVTISAGVATFPEHGRTRDQLIFAADNSLYVAKQSGRNRVLLANGARGRANATGGNA